MELKGKYKCSVHNKGVKPIISAVSPVINRGHCHWECSLCFEHRAQTLPISTIIDSICPIQRDTPL